MWGRNLFKSFLKSSRMIYLKYNSDHWPFKTAEALGDPPLPPYLWGFLYYCSPLTHCAPATMAYLCSGDMPGGSHLKICASHSRKPAVWQKAEGTGIFLRKENACWGHDNFPVCEGMRWKKDEIFILLQKGKTRACDRENTEKKIIA